MSNLLNTELLSEISEVHLVRWGGEGWCEHTCCTPLPMDLLQLKMYNIEPNFSYLQVCLKTHRVLDLHWKLSVIKVEKTLHETGSVLILI